VPLSVPPTPFDEPDDHDEETAHAALCGARVSGTDRVEIYLPALVCGPHRGGYVAPGVEVGRLTTRQSAALDRLVVGLDAAGATVTLASNPRGRVINRPDAIRWLLDQLADRLDLVDQLPPDAPAAPVEPPLALPPEMLGS
jgi:hypothetical protein